MSREPNGLGDRLHSAHNIHAPRRGLESVARNCRRKVIISRLVQTANHREPKALMSKSEKKSRTLKARPNCEGQEPPEGEQPTRKTGRRTASTDFDVGVLLEDFKPDCAKSIFILNCLVENKNHRRFFRKQLSIRELSSALS